MALGDSYATPAELEARLGRVDPGSYADALATGSRHVERYCLRQFNKTEVATARHFRPIDSLVAVVADFHTVTGLVVETDKDDNGTFETVWATADYELEPLDGVAGGDPTWPYWIIRAVGTGKWFPCTRRASLRVTAQWGWAAVPPGVKEATLATAEAIIGSDSGQVVGEAIDGYSVTYERLSGQGGPLSKAIAYRRLEGFA